MLKNSSIFVDDKFSHIEDDVEKIRTKTGMYIPYKGPEGAKHLAQELIDNVLDEINNPNSPGNLCEVKYDENINCLEVKDNGRGIPFDQVELICTKIQSGSKFDRDNGDDSAGENGVGLTAVNALSANLKFTIYRQISDNETQKGIFEFEEGKKVKEKITVISGAKHGTEIKMIPSRMILGDCNINPDTLLEWLEKLSYITKQIPINVSIIRKGSFKEEKYKFKQPNGIINYLNKLVPDGLMNPVYIKSSNKDNDISNFELAFNYDPKGNEDFSDSFVNRVNTVEGGQHIIACRSAITSVLKKLVNDTLSAADKKKYEISNDDCRTGLTMVVNMSCKYPGYAGQQKEKVGNKALFYPVLNMVTKALTKYFSENQKEFNKIANFLKKVAKSRIEVVRIRKSDLAGIDSFKSNKMANFSDATEDSFENELYLIEGLSAKGSIMKARDPRFQAALSFKGVTANSLALTPAQVMQNPEYATLVRASGMGIGKDFNIKRSRYKRYIVATDADIDGWRINSGIDAFFLFHWPEVVKAGMLYVALTPLYMIDKGNGNYRYLLSKAELFEEKVDGYVKKAQIRSKDGHVLSKKEMKDFLIFNKNYDDILKEFYTHIFVHPDIVEFVLTHVDDKYFSVELKEKFPEIKLIGENMLDGSYNGVYQFLSFDEFFYRRASKLKDAIDKNDGEIYFDYKDESTDYWIKDISLGRILRELKKYDVEIKHRWKGLGAIPPRIFWDIVMNPSKRTLVQITVDDIEKDMDMMRILHGPDAKLRRQLLQSYQLDKDDIDS